MPDTATAQRRRSASRWLVWLVGAVAALTLLVLAWGAALGGLLWLDLAPAEREALGRLLSARAGLLLLLGLLLPVMLCLAVRPWVAAWPRAVQRLGEEVAVITTTHAGHRVRSGGARELRELAQVIDALAQAHAALQRDVQARVDAARAALAEETRRLAALMAELTVGVLVCNLDGRVLLYNARAADLLGGDDDAAAESLDGHGGAVVSGEGYGGDGGGAPSALAPAAPLGLGRMVSSLLDAGAVDHAWQQVLRRHERGAAHAVAHFVTARRGAAAQGPLLRVQMVPTLDERAAPGGYVLLVDDITRSMQEHGRRDALLQRLTEGTRSALANLRTAVQALHRYPAMDAARRAGFTTVVHEEAERLAGQLDDALHEAAAPSASAWPLEDVQAGDLVWALQRCLRTGPGIECRFDGHGAEQWLAADSHAIVQMLAHLVGRLGRDIGVRKVTIEIAGEARAMRLDVGWTGAPLAPGTLEAWEIAPLAPGEVPNATRLREVLDRHGAELWSPLHGGEVGSPGNPERASPRERQRICLQFGAAAPGSRAGRPGAAPVRGAAPGRPIAYDFDLFHQAGQNARLDDTPLTALNITVFDTETTGLRPSEGDEIIAIGAVRIVNARLLEAECFDRRVRPRRAVRASAEAVHGISTASLAGEPLLEQVLPSFARFCEDTVLVAHNAAFDMRFLELARERTGVHFVQPVLDTMLLSAAVLPAHGSNEHHLEQIAARLGVPVSGRHEALGDAGTTARVLLKLMPLLAERGIVTLGQARRASQGVTQAHENY